MPALIVAILSLVVVVAIFVHEERWRRAGLRGDTNAPGLPALSPKATATVLAVAATVAVVALITFFGNTSGSSRGGEAARDTTATTTTTTDEQTLPTEVTTLPPPVTTQAVSSRYLSDFEVNTSEPDCDNEGPGVGWSTYITPSVGGQTPSDALWVTPDWQSGVMACGEIPLGGAYANMSGWVGVTDMFPSGSRVRLTFIGDGRELASVVPQLGQRVPIAFGVAGVSVLRINATLERSSTASSLDNVAIIGRLT